MALLMEFWGDGEVQATPTEVRHQRSLELPEISTRPVCSVEYSLRSGFGLPDRPHPGRAITWSADGGIWNVSTRIESVRTERDFYLQLSGMTSSRN